MTKLARRLRYSCSGHLSCALSLFLSIIATVQAADSSPERVTPTASLVSNPNAGQEITNQVAPVSLLIAGDRKGWDDLTPYAPDLTGDSGGAGQIDWVEVSMAHDCDDLYVRYELADGPPFLPDGFRYNLFVDVDRNPATGYRGTGKQLSVGADVLIQGGQNKITTFRFTGGTNQEAWGWQEVAFYPVSDLEKTGDGRDIAYRISISDLDVFGTGVPGFNWVAWADQPSNIVDYYPDRGNLGDGGTFNTYILQSTPRAQVFANPERGVYESTRTQSSKYTPLALATLQCYRENEGVSLIHRYFYLENFINSDISSEYLGAMQADFDLIRQAGMKVIPRFSYSETSGSNLAPPYGDASKERILSHLGQLSGVLQNNSDVRRWCSILAYCRSGPSLVTVGERVWQ